MKKPVALLLGLAVLGVAGAETAAAQGLYYYGPGPGYYGPRYYVPGLAPWRVARIVRSAGLQPLSAPARRGPIYEVVALDPEGRHMRVAVDAYRGAITSVRPVAVLRPNSEPYGARGPISEPYGSRVAVAPPSLPPDEDEIVPGPRLSPPPSQPGTGRIPPQAPYAGPSQGIPPHQPLTQQPAQPPQAQQPAPSPRIVNAPATTGTATPIENQRTPIPRPRPGAAATAAVTPAPSSAPSSAPNPAPSRTPAAAPSAAATTTPAEVPEAPPAPIRPRAPAAAAASTAATSANAKAATPATAANASAPTGSTSSATAKSEPRPPTTLVPVAPLE